MRFQRASSSDQSYLNTCIWPILRLSILKKLTGENSWNHMRVYTNYWRLLRTSLIMPEMSQSGDDSICTSRMYAWIGSIDDVMRWSNIEIIHRAHLSHQPRRVRPIDIRINYVILFYISIIICDVNHAIWGRAHATYTHLWKIIVRKFIIQERTARPTLENIQVHVCLRKHTCARMFTVDRIDPIYIIITSLLCNIKVL